MKSIVEGILGATLVVAIFVVIYWLITTGQRFILNIIGG